MFFCASQVEELGLVVSFCRQKVWVMWYFAAEQRRENNTPGGFYFHVFTLQMGVSMPFGTLAGLVIQRSWFLAGRTFPFGLQNDISISCVAPTVKHKTRPVEFRGPFCRHVFAKQLQDVKPSSKPFVFTVTTKWPFTPRFPNTRGGGGTGCYCRDGFLWCGSCGFVWHPVAPSFF